MLGPCHAEEVAAEKLSYLTFSGMDEEETKKIAGHFKTEYLNTLHNTDIYGVQYAAVLKNIYAIGAGIAHGLEYGDNFLSVLIANSADEMAGFLRRAGIENVEVGSIEHKATTKNGTRQVTNYAASVYLGDLLVTCYSPYSRNRTFGNMVGKGYTVKSALQSMNMIAEGYYAADSIYKTSQEKNMKTPIIDAVYRILYEEANAEIEFKKLTVLLN